MPPLDFPAVALIGSLSMLVGFAAGCLWLASKGREHKARRWPG